MTHYTATDLARRHCPAPIAEIALAPPLGETIDGARLLRRDHPTRIETFGPDVYKPPLPAAPEAPSSSKGRARR